LGSPAKAKNFDSLELLEGKFEEAQSNYEEALATLQHIMWLLDSEGLFPEFDVVTEEEYAADRDPGRAALRRHYPCTPSRHAPIEDRQQE